MNFYATQKPKSELTLYIERKTFTLTVQALAKTAATSTSKDASISIRTNINYLYNIVSKEFSLI